MFSLAFILLMAAGTVAFQLLLLVRFRLLAASVEQTLAESEKLRSQFAQAVSLLSNRASAAEQRAQEAADLAGHTLKLEHAITAREDEVKFLRETNAHLQNALYESAHTAQSRIIELVSPGAAGRERSMAPGAESTIKDGFRAMPPEDSPVDTIRYPEATRTVKTSAAPPEPPSTTTESVGYSKLQPSPAPPDFSALADVDEVFRS